MKQIFYTTGYSGKDLISLAEKAIELGAVVVDIRLHAHSRIPQWRYKVLREKLGSLYRHVPSLGNKNYKTGGKIEIADIEKGIKEITEIGGPVILMCGCKQLQACHRRVIARELESRSYETKELGDWKPI